MKAFKIVITLALVLLMSTELMAQTAEASHAQDLPLLSMVGLGILIGGIVSVIHARRHREAANHHKEPTSKVG